MNSSKDLIELLRNYQRWMKDGPDGRPSIDLGDIDADETFGSAATAIEALERRALDLTRLGTTPCKFTHCQHITLTDQVINLNINNEA